MDKKIIKTVMVYVAFTLIISQILSGLAGWTIVTPFLEKFGPQKVSIEPVSWPIVHNSETYIRVNIRNDGLKIINDLRAEYSFECDNITSERAELDFVKLKKDETASFEFQTNLDTNCSITTTPYSFEWYEDKITHQCYIKTSGVSVSNVCMYCILNITVYDGYKEIGNLSYLYPFSTGNITFNAEPTGGCLDFDSAPDKENLVYKPENYVSMYILEPCTGCLRGEIEKEWCDEYCKSE